MPAFDPKIQAKKDQEEKEIIERKKQLEEAQKQFCRFCGKQTFPVKMCKGHDLPPEPPLGGSFEEAPTEGGQSESLMDKMMQMFGYVKNAITHAMDGNKFNTEVISEMLSNRLLIIDNNKNTGIISIKLMYDRVQLTPEQQEELKNYIEALLKEVDLFKQERGLANNSITIDRSNPQLLRIMVRPDVYNTFIKHLANSKLLPKNAIEQEEKQLGYQQGIDHFKLTPFSTKLKFPSDKKAKSEDEKERERANPYSTKPRSPLDGPQPK